MYASKPGIKSMTKCCPAIQCDSVNFQFFRTAMLFVVYATVTLVFCVSIWALFPLSSDGADTTLSLSSNLRVRAVYKYAYENSDGTVDLVFNIPRGGEPQWHLSQNTSDEKGGGLIETTTESSIMTANTSHPLQSKSVYPLTLDSDYIINTVNVCPPGQQVEYILLVHSATAYFERRIAIRETYAGKGIFGNIFQRVVFLLGTTPDPVTTKHITEEAFLYRDIVQGAFQDSYHNLTHKGVLGIRWVSEYCPQAKFIVKIDDDVFINPFKLVSEFLPKFAKKTRHIACHLRPTGTSPIIRGKGKWQVHEDQFKGHEDYPFDYCNGYFVIFTGDLIRPMYKAARFNPFFWIDDVYLFGILPATIGNTTFTNINQFLSLTFHYGKLCYKHRGAKCHILAVSDWKPDEPEKLWYSVLSNLTDNMKEELDVFGLSKK